MGQRITVYETVPPTIAQQVFTIGSGIAGGLAGFMLARELVGVKEVPASTLAVATLVSAAFTFGAAYFLGKAVKKEY